jgi:hypothetical protein
LKTAAGYLVASKFANNKMVDKGSGDTIRVNKILRPAKQTTVSTAGTLITDGNAKALTSNYQEMSLEIWGDSFAFNEDVDVTSWISDKDNRDTIARQMAQSLDYQIYKKLATQGFRHRIDKDSTYVASGTASAGSTTSITGAFVTTTDDKNGGYCTITNPGGPNYDITSLITDCTENGSSDTAAVSFPQAITSSSSFHITVGTGSM